MQNCNKCQKPFPNKLEINGKIHNLQNRKYCVECSPFGKHNTKKIHLSKEKQSKDQKFCTICKTQKQTNEFYKRRSNSDPSPYCKICTNLQTVKRQQKNKILAVEYKGGKCIDCGYNKCIAALEFHHLDPNTKDPSINLVFGSFEKIKIELDKCVLLCCRCHRERHHLTILPVGS